MSYTTTVKIHSLNGETLSLPEKAMDHVQPGPIQVSMASRGPLPFMGEIDQLVEQEGGGVLRCDDLFSPNPRNLGSLPLQLGDQVEYDFPAQNQIQILSVTRRQPEKTRCDCAKKYCDVLQCSWADCARKFWDRISCKMYVHNQFPDFSSSSPCSVWSNWFDRIYLTTLGMNVQVPAGMGLACATHIKRDLAKVAFEFWKDFFLHGPRSNTPQNFISLEWKELLKQLNHVASAQSGLFWGVGQNGAPIYGRSQKVASLFGKYLLCQLLLMQNPSPAQIDMLRNLIRFLPGIVDRIAIVFLNKQGVRVFRNAVGGYKSWIKELEWDCDDYLQIQDAYEQVAFNAGCCSVAIYELVHVW